ncbi:Transcription factor [Acorus gramineus]|uniref:Transcription factor n=1 Tax=Acorus gramineus TaxID=55184 RepID=A0AAV9BB97_ACOGR|nr:Transcription factor [Acorus gramineus]
MDRTTEKPQKSTKRWKTHDEQRIYSTKLLHALRQVRKRSVRQRSAGPTRPPKPREAREAVDQVLATEAKGRTRWSQAILLSRILTRIRCRKRRPTTILARKSKAQKAMPAMERKVRVLERTVPDCRPEVVVYSAEEISNYIAALEMHVKEDVLEMF